ncbi:MAG TPA: dialkylresorcinol condensing enzyme [Solimonas sp.]|nr:dialkylresorcinol condensing enzyme [Solimonas sp.]
MKRVLVVHFSQTGQLRRVAESVCAPLAAAPDVELHWLALEPVKPYPFPWPLLDFFDQFPEAVHGVPPALKPLAVPGGKFDLVILAYTVWFLSPVPPMAAFLKSDQGRSVLRDTPVVTLVACRNMWLQAQDDVRTLLAAAGARHSDNIVLTDTGSALATFITTPRWMLTGRSDPVWGFPAAGIRAEDIAAASRFGRALLPALRDGSLDGRRPVLAGLKASTADERLIASERIGRRSFFIWGHLVRRFGPPGAWARKPVLLVYITFLVAMIVTVVPVTMLLRALLRPLGGRRLSLLKHHYESPSGSGSERMAEFS